MAVYENVFAKEFTDMMNQRRSMNTDFTLVNIMTPNLKNVSKDIILHDDFVAGGKRAYIKGILEPGFSQLNKTEVEVVKGRTFSKRMFLKNADGQIEFRKNADGSYMTQEVTLDKGFVAVYSPINLRLNNRDKHHRGYMYIDFMEFNGHKYVPGRLNSHNPKKMYLYAIPMEAVYIEELCALVISLNKHRAYYKGIKIALTNGHYVYVYSIPYKYRENSGYVMLGAKANTDFDAEVQYLLNFWMKNQILFDLNLTSLDSQVKGVINMGIQDIPGTCMPSEYQKITSAMKASDIEGDM